MLDLYQREQIIDIVRKTINDSVGNPSTTEQIQPRIVERVANEPIKVRTGVSNRHVHLDKRDLEILFGSGYELTIASPLSQEGMFAAEEKIILVGPRGCLTGVRILGPLRKNTQIEISNTDARLLGVVPPVMQSGTVGCTPELTLVGPVGTITNHNTVMIAQRHIHMESKQAIKWGLRDGDIVKARTSGPRAVVFENVVVRTGDGWVNEFHIDTDEGNASSIKTGDYIEVLKID